MSTTNPSDDPLTPDEGRPDRPGSEDPSTAEQRTEPTAERETPFTQQLGRIFVAIIAVLFGIFAVVNSQFVAFDWIFGETEVVEQGGERVSGGVPLIILLVVSFVLGGLAGWFATWRRGRHRRDAS